MLGVAEQTTQLKEVGDELGVFEQILQWIKYKNDLRVLE